MRKKKTPSQSADVTHDELVRAIEADPTSEEAYAVYADWLLSQGDRRGELIQVQLALESTPADTRAHDQLTMRESALFRNHKRELLGPLAAHVIRQVGSGYAKNFEWRRGFIHQAVISANETIPTRIDELLKHPSAKFLSSLHLVSGRPREGLRTLASLGNTSLRELRLSPLPYKTDDSFRLGNVLFERLPKLSSLWLGHPRMDLSKINAPNLLSLSIGPGVEAVTFESLTRANLASLQSFGFCQDSQDRDWETALANVLQVLPPTLETLRLDFSWTYRIFPTDLRRILKSRAGTNARQIHLIISHNKVLEELIGCRRQLPHLEALVIETNGDVLDDLEKERIQRAFPNVTFRLAEPTF